MKKVIKGKVYNTDTAKELGYWSNTTDRRDFSCIEETLYQKKTGEFFLFGEGGPMTSYAVASGTNSWSGGCRIMPMSYDEAKYWAEKRLSADELEAIFGEIVEDEETGKKVVSINVNAAKWEQAKRTAAQNGIGISEYIEGLL